jgi:hypothetical protein
VQIEQEMASDGLLRMGQGVLSETARNPTIPKLPSNQASKYVSLLDRTQMYLNVMRRKESTECVAQLCPGHGANGVRYLLYTPGARLAARIQLVPGESRSRGKRVLIAGANLS